MTGLAWRLGGWSNEFIWVEGMMEGRVEVVAEDRRSRSSGICRWNPFCTIVTWNNSYEK